MFEEILKQYCTDKNTHLGELLRVVDNYEFTAYCIRDSKNGGYVFVENADSQRAEEIKSIIKNETGHEVANWLVLDKYKDEALRQLGTIKPTHITADELVLVTYYLNHTPVWLLQLKSQKQTAVTHRPA